MSGSETRQRNKLIQVRCSVKEHAVILAKSDRAGLFPGGYLRSLALGAPGPRALRRAPIDQRELAQILGALGRIGNNLNQIAYALNAGRDYDLRELEIALHAFAEMRGAIHHALGDVTEEEPPTNRPKDQAEDRTEGQAEDRGDDQLGDHHGGAHGD